MQVILDTKAAFALSPAAATLPDALIEINAFLEQQGRALQAILVDGENIAPEHLAAALHDRKVSEVKSLEVRSACMVDLVLESINEVTEVLPELPVACQQLSQIIGGEAPHDGFKAFNDLLNIWDAISDRQRMAGEMLGVKLGDVEVEGETLRAHQQAVRKLIAKARGCMEQSDFVGLSQLLAYDLGPLAEREEPIMGALRERVEAAKA